MEKEKMITERSLERFLSLARAELVRIDIALDDTPSLKRKQAVLRDLLNEYNEPAVPEPSRSVPISGETLRKLERGRDAEADRSVDPVGQPIPRPPGIPTNFVMAHDVLIEVEPDGLTATLIVQKIRERWWPGVRFNQIAPWFYGFVNEGRMSRDDDGKMRLTEKGKERVRTPRPPEQPKPAKPPASPAPVKRALTETQIEQLRAKAAVNSADPASTSLMAFERGADHVMMTPPHWRVCDYLFQHMGEGCIGAEKLAHVSKGATSASPWIYVEDVVASINPRIAALKLQVVPYQKLGFFMREIP